MPEHFVCGSCGKRIHRSQVPNSITGNVVCCGRPMTGPGDAAEGVALLVGLVLFAAGAWLLHARWEWPWLRAVLAAAAAAAFLYGPAAVWFVNRSSEKRRSP